jgi:hypothetical protein
VSTKVMSACWLVRTEPSRKAVLISLADQANDDGICWPSVGTVAERTCLDERTVQRAIQDLQEEGHLTVQMRSGRSTIYRLHPRHGDTPVITSPPSQRHPTPVTVTPHPRHGDTQNRKGTVKEPKKGELVFPDWLPAEVWAEWHAFRNSGKSWTKRARQLSLSRLCKLYEEGHDPRSVVEQSIERGWTGLFPVKADAKSAASQSSMFAGAL